MKLNKLLILILILVIVTGSVIRLASLNKEYTGEEIDFIRTGLAIQQTGHPIIYHSEQIPTQVALWHPPMYVYTLALIFEISKSEMAARSVNILFSFLTAILIYIFCVNALKKNGKEIGLIASAIFLINYYTLSSSILIDIDLLSTFFTFLFIFGIVMYYKEKRSLYFIISIVGLFFSLWNRYPITGLVYLSVGAYTFFRVRDKFVKYLIIGLISGVLFLGSWTIYSTLIEPGNFFAFVTHNLELGAQQVSGLEVFILSFMLNISQFIRLVTFPIVIAFIISIFYFAKNKENNIKILLYSSLIILLFFFLIPRPAFGYPRYFVTAFPGICILLSILFYEKMGKIKLNTTKKLILAFLFTSSLFLLLLISPNITLYSSKGLIVATNLPDFVLNMLCTLPILLIFLFKRGERSKALVVGLLVIGLAYCVYFDIATLTYNQHIKETADYITAHTSNSDIIIAPKVIGFYTGRRFYVNDNNKPDLNFSVSYLYTYFSKSFTDRKNMEDEFFWQKGEYSGLYPPLPSDSDLHRAKYAVLYHPVSGVEPEKIIGGFYIYKLKG